MGSLSSVARSTSSRGTLSRKCPSATTSAAVSMLARRSRIHRPMAGSSYQVRPVLMSTLSLAR